MNHEVEDILQLEAEGEPELHYLHNSDPLVCRHHLDIGTYDADEQGWLLSNGTNRGLGWGLTEDGKVTIYMTSNGDDIAVPDELPDLLSWLYDLGDEPDPVWDRIVTGLSRLKAAVDEVSSVAALYDIREDDIRWYRNIIWQAQEAIDREDRDPLLSSCLAQERAIEEEADEEG